MLSASRAERREGAKRKEPRPQEGWMDAATTAKSNEGATGTAAAHEGDADTRRSSHNTKTQGD
jgi:hypothetical protein